MACGEATGIDGPACLEGRPRRSWTAGRMAAVPQHRPASTQTTFYDNLMRACFQDEDLPDPLSRMVQHIPWPHSPGSAAPQPGVRLYQQHARHVRGPHLQYSRATSAAPSTGATLPQPVNVDYFADGKNISGKFNIKLLTKVKNLKFKEKGLLKSCAPRRSGGRT